MRKTLRFLTGIITFRWLRRLIRNQICKWLGIDQLVFSSMNDLDRIALLEVQVRKLKGEPYVLFYGKLKVPGLAEGEPELWVPYQWAERVVTDRHSQTSVSVITQLFQPGKIEELVLLCGLYDIIDIKIGNISIHQGSAWPQGRPFRVPERMQEVRPGNTIRITLEAL